MTANAGTYEPWRITISGPPGDVDEHGKVPVKVHGYECPTRRELANVLQGTTQIATFEDATLTRVRELVDSLPGV